MERLVYGQFFGIKKKTKRIGLNLRQSITLTDKKENVKDIFFMKFGDWENVEPDSAETRGGESEVIIRRFLLLPGIIL